MRSSRWNGAGTGYVLIAGLIVLTSWMPAEARLPDGRKPADEAKPKLRLSLHLRDESRLFCTVPEKTSLQVQTGEESRLVELKSVGLIEFLDDRERVRVHPRRGKPFSGVAALDELEATTSFGEVAVPTSVILRLRIEKPPFQPRPDDETPARIETGDFKPVTLEESNDPHGWRRLPGFLEGARVYSEAVRPGGAYTSFRVTGSGIVYLACHFGYEGGSGAWKQETLTKDQFIELGWDDVGELVHGSGRRYTLFRKACAKGREFQLRCNKYTSPLVILLAPRPAEK